MELSLKVKQNALTLMVLRFWGFYICLCLQLIDDPFAHPGTQLKTFLFHTALHLITNSQAQPLRYFLKTSLTLLTQLDSNHHSLSTTVVLVVLNVGLSDQ